MQDKFYLGNLASKRDWGHAKDYVEAMYLMLQQDKPEDLVIATGITTTIRDFVNFTFKELGINVEFKGVGVEEKCYIVNCENPKYLLEKGKCILEVDSRYFRPTEVELLMGDASKAKQKLGWKPKFTLIDLIKDMVWSDIKLMEKDKYLKDGGFEVKNYFE